MVYAAPVKLEQDDITHEPPLLTDSTQIPSHPVPGRPDVEEEYEDEDEDPLTFLFGGGSVRIVG